MNTDRIIMLEVIAVVFGIIFSIFAVINGLVYLYASAKDFSIIQKNQLFKKAFQMGLNLGKEIETTVNEGTTKPQKAGRLFGAIVAILLFLLYTTINLSIPLIVGFMVGFQEAISTYFAVVIFTAFIRIIGERTRPNYVVDHKKDLLRALLLVFNFQLIIMILFGFTPQLDIMIQQIYSSTFFLKNTFSFLMPTLFIGSLLMTAYFYWTGLKINSKLNVGKNIHIRATTMLLIFVASSFSGIIYLIESDFEFIDMSGGSPFDRIFNTFIFLLSSILIPLMFNLISEAKKRKEDMLKNVALEQPIDIKEVEPKE